MCPATPFWKGGPKNRGLNLLHLKLPSARGCPRANEKLPPGIKHVALMGQPRLSSAHHLGRGMGVPAARVTLQRGPHAELGRGGQEAPVSSALERQWWQDDLAEASVELCFLRCKSSTLSKDCSRNGCTCSGGLQQPFAAGINQGSPCGALHHAMVGSGVLRVHHTLPPQLPGLAASLLGSPAEGPPRAGWTPSRLPRSPRLCFTPHIVVADA